MTATWLTEPDGASTGLLTAFVTALVTDAPVRVGVDLQPASASVSIADAASNLPSHLIARMARFLPIAFDCSHHAPRDVPLRFLLELLLWHGLRPCHAPDRRSPRGD